MKDGSNNAWYAAVESLRQARLFDASEATRTLFRERHPEMGLPKKLPMTPLVLAPQIFYSAKGQKAQSVAPTLRLLRMFQNELGETAQLAVWDTDARAIHAMPEGLP